MTAREIAYNAMERLRGYIRQAFEARGKNASGGTRDSMRTLSSEGLTFGTASLEANSNWKWVGNGRGPGKMPPIDPIRQWIASRGLDISEWAVAKKIAKVGSRDYRLKRRNLFLEEIEAWEKTDVPKAEQQMIDEIERRFLENIDKIKLN